MTTVRYLAGAIAALALAGPAQAADLARGETWFSSGPAGAAECGTRCWQYSLTTTQSASALRLGIDHATVGDVWTVAVTSPGGQQSSFSPGTGLYSQEQVITAPSVGQWTLRVSADAAATDLRFRLRAKLEGAAPPASGPRLPNLQALPPWDLSFKLPVSNGGALSVPSGSGSFGVLVPGGRTACHPEEVALEQAVRCLRMAFGVRNTGAGPMALEVGPGNPLTDRPLEQLVLQADGRTWVSRAAGQAVYHHTHQHYHHDKAVGLSLWRVTDAQTGTLEAAGDVHLKGFAHRNELLREWRVFYPRHIDRGFGLRAGWGDYYEWDRPGNYIDFAANPDGRYVVRLVADPVGAILESNEADNAAYSLIEVSGTDVRLLESGRGTDPWDPCRILVPFGAEPDLPEGTTPPRPADCPPDSSGL